MRFNETQERITVNRSGAPDWLKFVFIIAMGCLIFAYIFMASDKPGGDFWFQWIQYALLAVPVAWCIVFAFWRWHLVIHLEDRSVRTWETRLFRASKKKDYLLADFNGISLSMIVVQGGQHDSHDEYTIEISGYQQSFLLSQQKNPNEARRRAESIATTCKLPLWDDTSGDLIQRDAGHLDESVRDLAKRLATVAEVPASPESLQNVSIQSSAAIPKPPSDLTRIPPGPSSSDEFTGEIEESETEVRISITKNSGRLLKIFIIVLPAIVCGLVASYVVSDPLIS